MILKENTRSIKKLTWIAGNAVAASGLVRSMSMFLDPKKVLTIHASDYRNEDIEVEYLLVSRVIEKALKRKRIKLINVLGLRYNEKWGIPDCLINHIYYPDIEFPHVIITADVTPSMQPSDLVRTNVFWDPWKQTNIIVK
ncbi:hypothetical protein [Siphonobacter sp. SORGH_AS_0500]|uniref:hypothetical protein n=1 Tax=Siphonobacter sp. SORGH_AS_0500 TaxID=1864824 RepID=UPI0028594F46|nr:hypothetical protein [Siphonobacter sp. SORGH_AS_0500]MDR6196172.1 hypothetical protein [Siphonobacter sp. SORGH_AS_0500]